MMQSDNLRRNRVKIKAGKNDQEKTKGKTHRGEKIPRICCIKNLYKTYMHLIRREEKFKDIHGKAWSRYHIYKCECGDEHKLDRYQNVWIY
jgi:hypothetical protein